MKPRISVMVLAIAFLALGTGWAQDDEGPGRGVARLSLINGDVSVRRGDSGDWIAAAVNTPLVLQDRVITGAASRAEVQFDWANMLRLAPNSEVRLAELENQRYQVQVARGTVTLGVLRDSEAEIEVNTPQVSVRPVKRGLYRITVREDGQTEVTVRSGEAEMYTPRGTERLRSGRTMLLRGTASEPEFQEVRTAVEDDWDRWNENRNQQLERSRSYQYVSRYVYGADDLDNHGRWVYDAPYGWVWSPSGLGSDWAPYRNGRWAWVDWYGWTWMSYDPWGWAPFHYGRWFHHANRGWCWWPGQMHSRHYWRPGLVAFFGWGRYSGLHVGIGFGNMGWVPLAPYETFHPWYGNRYYRGYGNRVSIDNSVNIVNNINITNVYRNARVTNGVSGLEAGEFVRGRAARAVRSSEVDFTRASLVRGAVPVTPSRESLRVSDRTVQAANLPRASESARFYSRRQATTVDRVPFEQQRQGVEQMVRRSSGGGAAQTAEGVAGGNLPRTGTQRPTARGESGNLSRSEAGNLPRGGSESGWRRVGEPPRAETRQEGERGGRGFGEPVPRSTSPEGAGRVERQTQQPTRGGGSSEESWRRFGTPTRQPEPSAPAQQRPERAPQASPRSEGRVRPESDQSWSGSGTWRSPSTHSESSPRMTTPRSEAPSAPRRSEESPRQMERRGGGDSIRVNPPIVRERSAPRSESPRSESPRYERSSPPSGRTSGGEARGGGEARSGGTPRGGGEARSGGTPRGESGGSTTRSGGGRGRER